MKLRALLKTSFPAIAVAALAVGLSSMAGAETAPGPRPGTVEAMRCLVRQGPQGCEKIFVARAWPAARPWVLQDVDRDFKRGPLVANDFWGRASKTNLFDQKVLINQTTDEMDIFDIKFAHTEYTFYIAPPDADGKIRGLAIRLYPPHDLLQLQRRPV